MPLREIVRRGHLYVLKYLLKKYDAPADVLRHFRDRHAAWREAASQGPRETPVATVRLGLTGDLMWVRRPAATFVEPNLRRELAAYDAWVGNLETVISDAHAAPDFWFDYLRYNSRPEVLRSFRRPDGANLYVAVSLANNHVLDYGDAGLERTQALLESEGIAYTGMDRRTEDRPYTEFRRGGIRFGLCASTWGVNDEDDARTSAYRAHGHAEAEAAVAAMRRDGVEFRIASLHWGHEYEFYPTGEQIAFAERLIDAGADIVVGHHPHVVQPCEIRPPAGKDGGRRGIVFYSLGNFTTSMFTQSCRTGALAGVEVYRYASGEVDWGRPTVRWVRNRRRRLGLCDAPPWLRRHFGETT